MRLLTKADVGTVEFKIILTDEFGASRVVKQTVLVMYDAN
jgi:C4-type Zn-finger protein